MLAKAQFIGRIAKTQYSETNNRPRLGIQIITSEWYNNRENTSSFFVTVWGNYAKTLHENNALEKGFMVHADCSLNVTESNGQYYTNMNVDSIKTLSRPQEWHERRKQQQVNSQVNSTAEAPVVTDPGVDATTVDDEIPF